MTEAFDKPAASPPMPNRRAGADSNWLTPIADRNGDGTRDGAELEAWLGLQEQIAKGLLLLTLLDGGAEPFEILDVNHDVALSPRGLHTGWDRLHAAGCITAGELDRAKLPRTLQMAVSHGYPRGFGFDLRSGPEWFRAMDKNGDGDVSRREFSGPRTVFDRLDADHDALLTADEAAK